MHMYKYQVKRSYWEASRCEHVQLCEKGVPGKSLHAQWTKM